LKTLTDVSPEKVVVQPDVVNRNKKCSDFGKKNYSVFGNSPYSKFGNNNAVTAK